MPRRREYRRWVAIGFGYGVDEIIAAALATGAPVAVAEKPDFCCWYGLRIQATAAEMQAAQAAWTRAGMEWHARQPKGAWPI